jgi:hypothetical protein
MGQVGAGLVEIGDGVPLRGGGAAQPGDLREDEPHPVAALVAGVQLLEGLLVDALLSVDEAGQIGRHGCRIPSSSTTKPHC